MKLYVGNLPFSTSNQDLNDIFGEIGAVESCNVIEDRETSFAMKLGGGLDIRAGKRIDIRVIQIDYNPVFAGNRRAQSISGPFNPVNFTGKTSNNFTIGVGIVIH